LKENFLELKELIYSVAIVSEFERKIFEFKGINKFVIIIMIFNRYYQNTDKLLSVMTFNKF